MGMLLAGMRGLGVAAAIAAAACEAPDSTGLFGPTEAVSIRTETPGIEPTAGSSSDAGVALESDAAGAPSSEGALPPGAVPLDNDDTAEPAIDPPIPGAPAVDAGTASAPIPPDAGGVSPPPPAVEVECAGTLSDGVCWSLGELGQSCDAVCATRGGVDARSAAWIGTPAQGGSLQVCAALLEALGAPFSTGPLEGFREDALGFGCHLFVDAAGETSAWWLNAPDFSSAVSNPNARLVCGCAG